MRRRIIGNVHTGLGNPSPEKFDNEWTDNEEFNENVRSLFEDVLSSVKEFDEIGGFDFKITLTNDSFKIWLGIEPAYMYDPYICYCVSSNREEICVQRGESNGYYGSDIVINEELKYRDKDFPEEFLHCIERHYYELMSCLKEKD